MTRSCFRRRDQAVVPDELREFSNGFSVAFHGDRASLYHYFGRSQTKKYSGVPISIILNACLHGPASAEPYLRRMKVLMVSTVVAASSNRHSLAADPRSFPLSPPSDLPCPHQFSPPSRSRPQQHPSMHAAPSPRTPLSAHEKVGLKYGG